VAGEVHALARLRSEIDGHHDAGIGHGTLPAARA
jgi:hypothetical protein